MIIKNGNVFQDDKTFVVKDIYIENGVFVDSEAEVTDKTVVDATGLTVIPGLLDIHSHGAVACDFSDGDIEGLKKILAYECSVGVTSYCPTSMTLPLEVDMKSFAQVKALSDVKGSAHIAGINMEGPFIDPAKKGAQKEDYIHKPDADFFNKCNEASGFKVKLVTLAANMEGSVEFCQAVSDKVHISLGHTGANYAQAKAAFDAGADHVTHLYNAMPVFAHRDPGVIGAAADDDHVYAELICDGIHINPVVIRTTFRMFPDRVCLISDSMRAVGMGDGEFDLGGQMVTVKGKLATLADGTLAGSASNLFDCLQNCVTKFNIPMEEAVAAATINPAKSIGVFDELGSISTGKRADVLLVDKDFNLVQVIQGSVD